MDDITNRLINFFGMSYFVSGCRLFMLSVLLFYLLVRHLHSLPIIRTFVLMYQHAFKRRLIDNLRRETVDERDVDREQFETHSRPAYQARFECISFSSFRKTRLYRLSIIYAIRSQIIPSALNMVARSRNATLKDWKEMKPRTSTL